MYPIATFLLALGLSLGASAQDRSSLERQAENTRKLLKGDGFFSDQRALVGAFNQGKKGNLCQAAFKKKAYHIFAAPPSKWESFYSFAGNDRILKALQSVPKSVSQQAAQGGGVEAKQRLYLTESEARSLVTQGKSVCSREMKSEDGVCFLRSESLALVLARDFPSVPVAKLWVMAPMTDGDGVWKYHTVPIAPVLNSKTGLVEWRALDTLLSPQVHSVNDWTYRFADKSLCGRGEIYITDTLRGSPVQTNGFPADTAKTRWNAEIGEAVKDIHLQPSQ